MVIDYIAEQRKERNREAQRKFRQTKKMEEEEQATSLTEMETEATALEAYAVQLQEEKETLQVKLFELQMAWCAPLPNDGLNNSLMPLADVEHVDQDSIPWISTDLAKIPDSCGTQWTDIFDFDFDAPITQSLQSYVTNNPVCEAAPNSAWKLMQDLRSATAIEIDNLQIMIQTKQAIAQQIDDAICALQYGTEPAPLDWDALNLDFWPQTTVTEDQFLDVHDDGRLFEL